MKWFKYQMLLFLSIICVCIASDSNNEDAYYQLIQQNPPLPQHHQTSQQRQRPGGGGGGQQPPNIQEPRSTFSMLNQAVSQVAHHELSGDGACMADDIECINLHDQVGLEAIRSLHKQLDDDDNGNIDLSESDDFLREELKYDSGYEKRHRAFHYNDDMQISVKELWEAWLRSEVHNWTVDQTSEWLAQSVQLPQYVHLFRDRKVNGRVLPRLAVNNMHYVSNILGIKDPIHKQKIALKAMDAVLFGPPRETGTRWKDLLLVTLLLSAIIGSWYAYQQNKNAKNHLRRMAKDVEGLLKAELQLKDMQSELEKARIEQENVGKEKMDLERRLKEAPTLTSSCSDLELQQLKQEIELLRSELSRAEIEINDHCWTPPQGLQNWLQMTYELESKFHAKKRLGAEKQLQQAREMCEKLKKKRSSLVGAFVSTHGKSIDDVDRSIVEARNALSEVTNELQERMHRWKQIETLLGFNIVNNNGLSYLESVLYSRNGSIKSRGRLTNSQDDLDDDSVQGFYDGICKSNRDEIDSSTSDDGDRDRERDTVTFILGCPSVSSNLHMISPAVTSTTSPSLNHSNSITSTTSSSPLSPTTSYPPQFNHLYNFNNDCAHEDNNVITSSNERIVPAPRTKKSNKPPQIISSASSSVLHKAPMPPPRKTTSSQSLFQIGRSKSSDMVALESADISFVPSSAKTVTKNASLQQYQQIQQFIDNNMQYKQYEPTFKLQEDTCSTDSSTFDDDLKRRRRKFFPFSKRFSSKSKKSN